LTKEIKDKRRAVFLDRDGTINEEVGYLSNPEEFVLIDGSAEAVLKLNQAGLLVVVVSNQSGVARGYFTEDDVKRVNEKMTEELEKVGARLDAIYYCPHHSEFGDEKYRAECNCRKPMPGMVEEAKRKFDIDVSRSFVVGDHAGDIELAHNVGASSIFVLTGHGREEYDKMKEKGIVPDYTADNLLSAVAIILKEIEKVDKNGA
jgi:D-glycero-D-manno-heptose 1,7-bisphosphate phosphatase